MGLLCALNKMNYTKPLACVIINTQLLLLPTGFLIGIYKLPNYMSIFKPTFIYMIKNPQEF